MTDYLVVRLREEEGWYLERAAREAACRIERLEAALRFYACDCKPECKCGLEHYSGVTYCGHTARKALEGRDDSH